METEEYITLILFYFLQPPDRFCLTAANYRLRNSKDSQQKSRPGGGGNIRNAGNGNPTYTIRPSGQTNTNRPPITMNQSTMPRLQLNSGNVATPTFTMTVNATTPSVKRKADD